MPTEQDIIDAMLRPMVGTVITLELDADGNITRTSGGSALSMTGAQLFLATLQLAVVTPLFTTFPTRFPLLPLLAIAALGALGTGLALLIQYGLVTEVGPTTAQMVTYFIPVIATAAGVALLGESLTWSTPAGAAIVLAWRERRYLRLLGSYLLAVSLHGLWNALAMVVRANKLDEGIGGHISTYASAATLYEVGFNHFFKGKGESHDGDIIFFQGHARRRSSSWIRNLDGQHHLPPVPERRQDDKDRGLSFSSPAFTYTPSTQSHVREVNSRQYVSWFNFRGGDQQKLVKDLSGGERNRVHLAKLLRSGGNLLLLDEPTNDLDVDTLRALEEALNDFAGCAVVISHDRWFLDRIATHILAFEGDSHVEWFAGNYQDYEADRHRRLGDAADRPSRLRYRKFSG